MGDNAASYHGLVNRGATCYLNSVLQVLFMTEEFREAVNRLTSPSEEYIDHHLKGLFEKLLRQRADPYNILRALGVNKVTEQQDAAEYFERILKKTSGNAAQIFHGRLSHRTECLKCQIPNDSEGPFWHLPLELEDSCGGNYSVENGIEKFFTSTTFDGDNQLYCERCDDKVDATRKYVITHHPPVLLLMLKRFDFSYQFMSYIKINCNADVPHTIEIPENQTYELYAVVEHFGDLRGGHYQAVIKSKDEGDEWFVFNDSSVTQLGVNPFPDNVNVTQSIGAYLLFYRRKANYYGLVNHGATDYLNSVLQVLFMTEEFREAVIRLISRSEEYIDHHLKGLFEELLRRRADPYNILRALGVNNVCEQQDAAEYFERILRKTSGNVAKIFHGRLSHRTTCLKCQTMTDSEGPFWHLPLELEDSSGGNYSVENGIKMFFTSTIFDGDNQMYCDSCDDKVDATRKCVITHHPPVLLLMLKRFDFSYQFMSYIKINCNADIPHTIEIPENQTYELYAVVEHFGDLRGGHYRAVIKSKDEGDEWFVFNDSSVTQLGVNPFPDNVNVTQSIGAYLLFYRKKVADRGISGLCSDRDYNPNINQDQSQKENLQPGDDTETLDGNISLTDKEGKLVHMPTEAEPEVRNPEKREINESEKLNPPEDRLQRGRGRQTERLSQDEIKYPQDITMEDVEEQEENRNQLTGEDQIQSLDAGETEPKKLGNMQTDMNYDHHVESAEPADLQRQKNLFEHQVLLEDRTDEERRKHETENSNRLITTSEEAGAADESENNKPLPAENMNYNHIQAENAALNKLEENEEIGEEASHVKENLPVQDNDKIPQSLLSPDENQLDDKNQRRNEMTVDVSKTQKQETEDVDETHFHKDRPKLDDCEESKQKSQKTGKRKRNRSEQGKKENQDHTDRTGDDQMAAYSDSPAQPYLDEAAEVIKKKHTKQKVQTSHDAQNELDLKKTRTNKNYKMAATLTGNQEADRDKETRQENLQSYRNKGSEDAEVRRQGPNQGAFERKTIEIDFREFSPGGTGKTKLMIKTITEETTTVNNNNNRTTISDELNVDCDLERGDLPSAKEETAILSEPLLLEQNPTSKKITRGANEDKYRLNISSETDLEAQQKRHDMKKKCSCRCSCVIS